MLLYRVYEAQVRPTDRLPGSVASAVCLASLFVSLPVWGQNFGVVAKPYEAARSLLMKSGLKPVALKHDRGLDFFCEDDFCKLHPEALNCAGTGLNPCMFVYFSEDQKRYLIVDTHGEIKLTVTGTHWAHDYEIKEIRQRE